VDQAGKAQGNEQAGEL